MTRSQLDENPSYTIKYCFPFIFIKYGMFKHTMVSSDELMEGWIKVCAVNNAYMTQLCQEQYLRFYYTERGD